MSQPLDIIVGQVQVFFASKFEGTISDLTVRRSRATASVGTSSGANVVGFGIDKYSVSFKRPALKDSSRQIDPDTLNGPIDIDYVRGDQTYRIVGFIRADEETANNPDQGSTTESYSGVASKRIRIK